MRIVIGFVFFVLVSGAWGARAPKTSYIDAEAQKKIQADRAEPGVAMALAEAQLLRAKDNADLTSQAKAAGIYEKLLKDYPERFISFEVRRYLIATYNGLYTRTSNERFKTASLSVGRESLTKVDAALAKGEKSEYLEWIRGEYLFPMLAYGGECPKEDVAAARRFYEKSLAEDNLVSGLRINDTFRLIEIDIYDQDYAAANKQVDAALAQNEKGLSSKDLRENLQSRSNKASYLFYGIKVAILSGDKAKETERMKELQALKLGPLEQDIERALDRVRRSKKEEVRRRN